MNGAVVTMMTYDTIFDLQYNSVSTTDVDAISSTAISMKSQLSAVTFNDVSLTFPCLSSNYFSLILLFESSVSSIRSNYFGFLNNTVTSQDTTLAYIFSTTFDFNPYFDTIS